MGSMPKTSAEKDALREMIDEMQVSETKDEENFLEAKQLARHAYAPFEIPSEVRAVLADPKVEADSSRLEPFWYQLFCVAQEKRFTSQPAGVCLAR
jgi:hypothetical protein